MDNAADYRRRAQTCRDMAAKGGTEEHEYLKAATVWDDMARRTELLADNTKQA